MAFQKYFMAIGFLTMLSAVGCSNSPQKTSKSYAKEAQGHAVMNSAAREAEAHNFVEIKFRPGSASLTDSAKSSLNSIIKQARQGGKIDEVIVLSWSDEEYPSKNLAKLSKDQRELAEKRNKTVEQYVKTMKNVDVNSYNMAERPSSFSKLFNTADSKLKNSLLSAGLSTTADSADYANKASRSVILVKIK
ncbi:MAG: hypothetical protein H7281_03920 [Bacteriovorax sp.]|nr:hypothetical protein [Bacteriovorax sp.]